MREPERIGPVTVLDFNVSDWRGSNAAETDVPQIREELNLAQSRE